MAPRQLGQRVDAGRPKARRLAEEEDALDQVQLARGSRACRCAITGGIEARVSLQQVDELAADLAQEVAHDPEVVFEQLEQASASSSRVQRVRLRATPRSPLGVAREEREPADAPSPARVAQVAPLAA